MEGNLLSHTATEVFDYFLCFSLFFFRATKFYCRATKKLNLKILVARTGHQQKKLVWSLAIKDGKGKDGWQKIFKE